MSAKYTPACDAAFTSSGLIPETLDAKLLKPVPKFASSLANLDKDVPPVKNEVKELSKLVPISAAINSTNLLPELTV